jgi:RND family efflux transporter MFP subunit
MSHLLMGGGCTKDFPVQPFKDRTSAIPKSGLVRQLAVSMSALSLATLSACGGEPDTKDKAATASTTGPASAKAKSGEVVVVEVVRSRALSGGIDVVATGAFRREREIDLSFRIPGVLRQVNFREGDIIAQGSVVAAIDPTQVDAQIAQAQAQAMQASAGIGQAQEQANAAGSSILAARAGQAQAIASAGQADANVGRAQAGLAQARADYENARRELTRDQTLANKGYVSSARLDSRQTRVDVALANVNAAQAAVVAAQQTAVAARAGISAASAGVNQAQAGAGAAVAGVRAASGRAQAAQAGVNSAAFDRRWARLLSPATGVVLTRLAEPGEVTAPGQPVLVMADEQSPLILRTPVSDRDVARIKVGDAARIRVAAIGADLTGEVSRVAERADPRTGAFDVDVRVAASEQIKTGFFAEARILATAGNLTPGDQVLVPAEALIEAANGQASLYVVGPDAKTAKRQRVGFVGFRGGEAIVTGLAVGAGIVTSGGGYLSDGSQITVVERTQK